MNKIRLVAVDLAKRCYQVAAIDEHGQVLYNRRLSAKKFALAMQQLEPTTVAMEACAAAHHWGRRLIALGHQVRLVPPQHAKAFRRVHKSDAHDAVSIAEAALRPNIHFVPVKTLAQQDLQLLRRIRERLVSQRTALLAAQDPSYERLLTIPGIGPTIAAALLASVGHAQQFVSARQCSAWAGLVPKQHRTGGRVQLGAITKNGNRSLRVMLIHGVRTVIRWADRHHHPQSRWITDLVARRGKNKATVALANKLMRIAWVVLTQGVRFEMHKAFRPQVAR